MANNSDDADVIASARGRRVGAPFIVDAEAAQGTATGQSTTFIPNGGCRPRPAPGAGRVASSKDVDILDGDALVSELRGMLGLSSDEDPIEEAAA